MITESAAAQWDLELADLFLTIGHPFGRVGLRCRMRDCVRGLLARSPARTAGCATRPHVTEWRCETVRHEAL
ncbi:hypothetical protein [Streptomyces caniscabiei]|uniref:hypothetical protein n=1 Tax=Streptomyces caniscabiei TaxID=2746961 RepID=UPI0038F7DCD0